MVEYEPGKKLDEDSKRALKEGNLDLITAIRTDIQDGAIAVDKKDDPDPEIQGLVYVNRVPVLKEDQEDILWSGRKKSSE
jgi:hypothetical protein